MVTIFSVSEKIIKHPNFSDNVAKLYFERISIKLNASILPIVTSEMKALPE